MLVYHMASSGDTTNPTGCSGRLCIGETPTESSQALIKWGRCEQNKWTTAGKLNQCYHLVAEWLPVDYQPWNQSGCLDSRDGFAYQDENEETRGLKGLVIQDDAVTSFLGAFRPCHPCRRLEDPLRPSQMDWSSLRQSRHRF